MYFAEGGIAVGDLAGSNATGRSSTLWANHRKRPASIWRVRDKLSRKCNGFKAPEVEGKA
jgi:hypothetical protein